MLILAARPSAPVISSSTNADHRAAPAGPTWGARKIHSAAIAQAIAPSAVKKANAAQAAAAEKPFARWASLFSVKASTASLRSLSIWYWSYLAREDAADHEAGGESHHHAGERLIF